MKSPLTPAAPEAPGRRIALIGGGAAGLSAAYLLRERHEVTLYEATRSPGGHAHTVVVPDGVDAGLALDVGFMVLNDRNYPTMHALLARLGGVEVAESEMSFGYTSSSGEVQYALNWAPQSEYARRLNLTRGREPGGLRPC